MATVVQPLTLERDVARAIELLEKLQESGDVPGHKLQSLKKVLQSEFCTAIREVYQYMHETITVNGCPEYQARATAKATVAAFAASEGHSHPRVVELPKTEEGLGFNVMGGKEQNSPIYISRIIPGGVAERHGGLKRGDQLLSVNGVSVEGEHHEKAVELLKAAKDSVKLVVRYTPKVLEEMEARFEKLRTARRRQQQQLLMQQQQQQNLATQQNHMSLFQKKKKSAVNKPVLSSCWCLTKLLCPRSNLSTSKHGFPLTGHGRRAWSPGSLAYRAGTRSCRGR
ncbi:hypothetical protein CCH79_00014950, partial [Gambusia affinis]